VSRVFTVQVRRETLRAVHGLFHGGAGMPARKYWCELWHNAYQSELVESFHDFVDPSWQPSVVNCLAEAIKRRNGKESKIAEYGSKCTTTTTTAR
jgi:hypothetical protein